jgi:hypothetical protein
MNDTPAPISADQFVQIEIQDSLRIIQSTVLELLMSPTSISMRSQCGQCASLNLLVESKILRCDSLKWSDT